MGISDEHKAGLNDTLKQLNLSNQEVDKFSKAFKDPEFLKLFEEYAKEVSDPKVKEETDLYLRQLESEGRGEDVYGKGVMLVVPTEAFVIKTRDVTTGQKAFINICTSEKLEKITMESRKGPDGKPGRHVEIPLSLSLKKTGTDKGGQPAWIWDFVVHPETVEMAHKTPAIKKVLVETAFEQIKGAHQVTLSDEFKVLNMKYKGTADAPKPHVLSVRTSNVADGAVSDAGSRIRPMGNAPGVHGMPTGAQPPAQQSEAGALKAGDEQGSRSAFKFPRTKDQASKTPLAASDAGYKHESGEVTPQWEIIHRGQVDLTDCWGDSGRGLAAALSSYPEQLVLRLDLPGCKSAASVELDVDKQNISVLLPGKFKLETSLPFPVDDTKGKAKFDKTKQQLEIVLPTVAPPRPPPTPLSSKLVSALDDGGDDLEDDGQATADLQVEPNRQREVGQCGEANEGTNAAGAEGEGELTENQRKWMEMHRLEQEQQHLREKEAKEEQQRLRSQAAGRQDEEAAVAVGVPGAASEEVAEFEPSSAWTGSRPGRVFKKGPSGLGYYKDSATSRVVQATKSQQAANANGPAAAVAPVGIQLKPRLYSTIADDLD